MADFALLAPNHSYHSSLGACLDAFTLVQGQVKRLFAAEDNPRMETRLHLLTTEPGGVRLADGRVLPADGVFDAAPPLDLVHIAGFRVDGFEKLEERLAAAQPLFHWLRKQSDRGVVISASGPAILLLAEAGLLESLRAPLPRALVPLARERFPRLQIDVRRAVIDHGNIILGSGLASDPMLMVRVVERMISGEMGRWLASVMGSDQAVEDSLSADPLVASAQLWLEQRFAQDIKIADLAVTLSASHQTLIRRFQRELGIKPREYVQHLRVQAAARMLRLTNRKVDQIAALVGYRDTRSFRTVFHKHIGSTATAYRAQVRAEAKHGF